MDLREKRPAYKNLKISIVDGEKSGRSEGLEAEKSTAVVEMEESDYFKNTSFSPDCRVIASSPDFGKTTKSLFTWSEKKISTSVPQKCNSFLASDS